MSSAVTNAYIPSSHGEACRRFRGMLLKRSQLHFLSKKDFLCGWFSLFYIAPGLHPDEGGHSEGGWPIGWRCFAEEAFRRDAVGDLTDDELYPATAAHAALAIS